MTERSDDSDGSQLDGLPRHWPHEGVDTHQEPAAAASLPDTSTPITVTSKEEITRPPQRRDAIPPPVVTDKRTVSLPEAAASYGIDSEIVASPEVLNKSLPEKPKEPKHIDNPDDLQEHLASVTPVPSKHIASAVLEDPGIKDLGWRDDVARPVQLIRGVDNESVFTLIRRFNKQVQYVRAIPSPAPGLLDLDIATDEEFSPDKLRANLERLYMTVIVGVAAFGKHIARLRSWNEPRRSTAFALAYFASWHLNLLPAALLSTLLLLTFCPPSRHALFPPAPLAAVSAMIGNLQVPRAGTFASDDSLTGAPEAHPGEAVEQEAAHFVASVAAIGTGAVLGQGGTPKRKKGDVPRHADNAGEMEVGVGEGEGERRSEDSFAGALPDPSDVALRAKDVKDNANANASGGREDPAARVAKRSVEGAVWERMRPVMRVLADVVDGWERVANALEPVPPFAKYEARLRMAAVVVPLLVASLTFRAEAVLRGMSFFIGVLFFSQPVLSRSFDRLNRRVPHWRERLAPRRTILRGVPTNAQLTLTLLRIAEQAHAPLPPPPIPRPFETAQAVREASPGDSHPQEVAEQLKEHDFEFDAENYDVDGVKDRGECFVAPAEGETSWSDEGTYVEPEPEESTDRESVESASASASASDIPQGNSKAKDKAKGKAKAKKRGSKLVGLLKKTTRAGVGGVLGVDHLKAKAGDEGARRRLGAVPPREDGDRGEGARGGGVEIAIDVHTEHDRDRPRGLGEGRGVEKRMEKEAELMEREGPTSFSARVNGRKGRVLVVSSAASPCVSFVAEKPLRAALGGGAEGGIEGEFSIGVADIVALRKKGGFGWKGKLVVGWATGREVLNGLEIVDRWGGRRVVTAVKGRDELFNRLVSMGAQRWECL